MRLRAWMMIIALSTTLPAEASAQNSKPGAQAFANGMREFLKGEYEAALGHFNESQRQRPSVTRLLNIAICEHRLGLPEGKAPPHYLNSALKHYKEVLPQLPPADKRYQEVKGEIDKLTPRLQVTIAPATPNNAAFTLDGSPKSRTELEQELMLDPGKHVITVAAYNASLDHDITLDAGDKKTLDVSAPPKPPPPPIPPPTASSSASAVPTASSTPPGVDRPPALPPVPESPSDRALGFTLGAAGLVGIGLGIGFSAWAASNGQRIDEGCRIENFVEVCNPGSRALRNENLGITAATMASLTMGGLALTSSIIVLLVDLQKSKSSVAKMSLGWTGTGLTATGRW